MGNLAQYRFSVLIDFRVNDLFIGEEGSGTGAPRIEARVVAPDKIEFVDVLRDGELIHREKPGRATTRFSIIDRDAPHGCSFYILRLKLVGDPSFNTDPKDNSYMVFEGWKGAYPFNFARTRGVFAWTSPVWHTRK